MLARFACLIGSLWLVACNDAAFLSGKLCDQEGRCLDGYVCDPLTNRCLPADEIRDGDGGGDPDGGQDGGEIPAFALDPSNLDGPVQDLLCGSGQALLLRGEASIDTSSGTITASGEEWVPEGYQLVPQPMGDWPQLAVFSFHQVTILPGARVTVDGEPALVILSCTDITINGLLDSSGRGGLMAPDGVGVPGRGGPGGFAGGRWSGEPGRGPGGGAGGGEAECNALLDSGGAGGGFGGAGGAGGDGGDPKSCGIAGPPGGRCYGGARLQPLIGGSGGGGGGGGDNYGGPGGGGGGAVQLGANQRIRIGPGGGILAGGGGGAGGHDGKDSSAGGGAGAGGAILLEAREVEVLGVLAANGGGGGAGYKNNNAWTDQVAENGAGGLLGAEAAPGGSGSGLGGAGGSGSAGTDLDGQPGAGNQNGGGGGGGAGRIRINTLSGSADVGPGAIFSPTNEMGRCTGLCSLGTAGRR